MERVLFIKIVSDKQLMELSNYNYRENYIVKNIQTGQIFIGNNNELLNELKSDNSNNWAKTFFYGGN